MSRWIASVFGIGYLPGAPGTWGSLAALPLAYALHYLGSFPLLATTTFLLFVIGLWAASIAIKDQETHDPSWIVVDEVVGQWLALFPLSAGLWLMAADPTIFPYPGWIVGFLAFRFFDILKPWPVSWADRMETPLGLMLDDVIAGILASLVVLAAASLAHSLL